MIHILAAFAEHERSMISERTKAALLAAKSRGVRLGANGVVLAAASKAAALEYAEGLRSVVQSAQLRGARTLEDFSRELNGAGVRTRQGQPWSASTVHRLLRRLELTS